MSQISAAAVKELRDRTDMPMMKCKAALEKAGGDMEKAIQVLREEGGKFLASDKGARETAEGRIGAYSDHKTAGALVELRCEGPLLSVWQLQLQHSRFAVRYTRAVESWNGLGPNTFSPADASTANLALPPLLTLVPG